MDTLIEHSEIKKLVTENEEFQEKVTEISGCEHPFRAVEILCNMDVATACAIIDALPPMSGAFILFCVWVRSHGYNDRAKRLFTYARELKIPAAEILRLGKGDIYMEVQLLLD